MPVSLEEYLSTSYDPDLELVDGLLVERNVGEWIHSLVQSNIIFGLSRRYPGIYALPALRSQTRNTRYRLPDGCVLLAAPKQNTCSTLHLSRSKSYPKPTA